MYKISSTWKPSAYSQATSIYIYVIYNWLFAAEKCDLMEQQGSTYADQLAKRKQMIGDIESNLR